jgi:hypothetical protein
MRTPLSLSTYIIAAQLPGTFVVGMDPTNQDERFAYTLAPVIYAKMLFVAEHVLKQPNRADVEAVFRG